MNKFLLPAAGFTLLVAVLAIGIKHAPEKGLIRSPLIGRPAPDFALGSLMDTQRIVRSQDLRGHPYLFNVWGTWCPQCRVEHDMLLHVQRSGRVPLIGLNWQDDDAEALAYLSKFGNPYQVVLVDRDGRTAIDWGVYGAPETFLVNAGGLIVYKHVGALTPEVWEREFLPRLEPNRTAAR